MDGEEKVKDIFKTNWFLALTSVLCAVVIWVYVVYFINPMFEMTLKNIPVTFTNESTDFENGKLTVLSSNSETVNLRVRGKRGTLSRLSGDNVTCTANMTDIKSAGTYTLPIAVNFNIDGVELMQKNPYNIVLKIDKVITGEKEIKIETQGKPAEGFIAENVEYSPLKIRLTGAKSIVNKVDTASINVDLTGADDNISGRYKIKLYDENGDEFNDSKISKNVSYAEVKYNIYQMKNMQISAKLSAEENSLGEKVTVSKIKPSSVKVIGDKRDIMSLEKLETEEIDVSHIRDGAVLKVKIGALPKNSYIEDSTEYVEITFGTQEK